jgi:hypothetical protein
MTSQLEIARLELAYMYTSYPRTSYNMHTINYGLFLGEGAFPLHPIYPLLYSNILTLPLEWSRGQEFHAGLSPASEEALRRKVLREIISRHVGGLHMNRGNDSKESPLAHIRHRSGELNTLLVCLSIDAEIHSGRVVIVDRCRPSLKASKLA